MELSKLNLRGGPQRHEMPGYKTDLQNMADIRTNACGRWEKCSVMHNQKEEQPMVGVSHTQSKGWRPDGLRQRNFKIEHLAYALH